jgi:LAO/AO transport system kinase
VVVLVTAARGEGLDELDQALADHRAWLAEGERLARKRRAQEDLWVEQAIRARFGSAGLRAMRATMRQGGGPFAREHAISSELLTRLER